MTTKLLRTLMGMVALVAMLTACSSEDVILDEPNAKNEITFNITTNRASRAAQVYDSQNCPQWFRFSAWDTTNDELYVDKDFVKNTGSAQAVTWKNDGGVRFWPGHGEKLNFYAWVIGNPDANANPDKERIVGLTEYQYQAVFTNSDASINNFKQAETAPEQVDFLYATSYENSRTSETIPASQAVDLTFRHALSQVVFEAINQSNKIHVEIHKIALNNILNVGNFNFPYKATDVASWTRITSLSDNDYVSSTVNFSNPKEVGRTVTNLTYWKSTDEREKEVPNAMMMIPFKYENKFDKTNPQWNRSSCAYISIECVIWNVVDGGTVNKINDNVIFGTKTMVENEDGDEVPVFTPAELRIPIDIDWSMSTRYIYKFTFGTGNAGYVYNSTNGSTTAATVPMTYVVSTENWTEDNKNVDEQGELENWATGGETGEIE